MLIILNEKDINKHDIKSLQNGESIDISNVGKSMRAIMYADDVLFIGNNSIQILKNRDCDESNFLNRLLKIYKKYGLNMD